MNRIRLSKSIFKGAVPFEHLDFILKNTTPSQRFRWLEEAWRFWYDLRKSVYPKRIIQHQDKFRAGKI